jgi:hypothetical protein
MALCNNPDHNHEAAALELTNGMIDVFAAVVQIHDGDIEAAAEVVMHTDNPVEFIIGCLHIIDTQGSILSGSEEAWITMLREILHVVATAKASD